MSSWSLLPSPSLLMPCNPRRADSVLAKEDYKWGTLWDLIRRKSWASLEGAVSIRAKIQVAGTVISAVPSA